MRRQERFIGFSKYASELSESIKGWKFLDQLLNCKYLEHYTVINFRLHRKPLQPHSS
jgi:predicted amidophosphoribosyltransferase